MVRDLAARAGLPMPRVYLIDNPQPNAFATGRNPENAAVAATTGILRLLTRDELAGVMAHELAHVRNRDTLIMTVSATVAGAIASLAQFGFLFGGRGSERPNPVVMLATAIIAPLAAAVIQMAISRSREYEADRVGAEICGRPLALASALAQDRGRRGPYSQRGGGAPSRDGAALHHQPAVGPGRGQSVLDPPGDREPDRRAAGARAARWAPIPQEPARRGSFTQESSRRPLEPLPPRPLGLTAKPEGPMDQTSDQQAARSSRMTGGLASRRLAYTAVVGNPQAPRPPRRRAGGTRPGRPAARPRRGAGAGHRHRDLPAPRHDPAGGRGAGRPEDPRTSVSSSCSPSARRRSSSSTSRTTPPSTRPSASRRRTTACVMRAASSTRCCAGWRGSGRRSSPASIRPPTRPHGSLDRWTARYGEDARAPHRRGASRAGLPRPHRQGRCRRVGASASGASCCRPAASGSSRARRCATCPASRTAPGGCRMRRPPSRPASSASKPGERVADLCAAPGGKTAQLAAASRRRRGRRPVRQAPGAPDREPGAPRASPPRPASRTRPSSTRRPSTPSCSMRPARRPGPCAATRTSPGPRTRWT